MGTMIVAEDWLADIVILRKPGWQLAGTLLRAQIVTANRTGHLVDLRSEAIRRRVKECLRTSAMPRLILPCMSCHCPAWLADWVKATVLTPAQVRRIAGAQTGEAQSWTYDFLRPCRGEKHAEDYLQLTAPAGGGVL